VKKRDLQPVPLRGGNVFTIFDAHDPSTTSTLTGLSGGGVFTFFFYLSVLLWSQAGRKWHDIEQQHIHVWNLRFHSRCVAARCFFASGPPQTIAGR
jgi:hypothetical protein